MNKQSRQAGFTLIEIIAVLIILGILAAVATPKFMSMQKEARVASAKQLKATMQSAAVLCYSKANLLGVADNGTITKAQVAELKGNVQLSNGYPANLAALMNAMDQDGYDISGNILILKGKPNCGVEYKASTGSGLMPEFNLKDGGC